MGKRGPKPTPTPILKLRGSSQLRRRTSRTGQICRGAINEPDPPKGLPDPPEWLDETARAAWHELAPVLDEMGVLSRIDGRALAAYCRCWSEWVQLQKLVMEKGHVYAVRKTVSGPNGERSVAVGIAPLPQAKMAHQLYNTLNRLAAELGLTPSSRTRIHVENRKPEGLLAKYLGNP